MKQKKDLEFGQQWEKINRSANIVLTVLVLAWSLGLSNSSDLNFINNFDWLKRQFNA